jgi:GNAT superfamily N-acetyltransferase
VYAILDREAHPFHKHAFCEYFVALRNRRIVGRIAMIENYAHNTYHEERAGHFGFLEAENDREVFAALMNVAKRWCKRRGLDMLRGPCSPSTNEECGLLVQGFEVAPTLMTPHTPPYYHEHIEALGLRKAADLLNFHCDKQIFLERIPRMAERIAKKNAERGHNVVIRPLDMSRFDSEVEIIKHVYNSAWGKNWGFVPMTDAEINRMAADLKPVIVPEIVFFAECDGQPAGFLLGLPDYNMALRHMGGNLGPVEAMLFLLLKRNIHRIRLLGMGVKAEYRARGIETCLIAAFAEACLSRGLTEGELGWVLEGNKLMTRGILGVGGKVSRVHRLYEIETA